MLVLSRKVSQYIMIGNEVRIVVVGFDGDQVKLGVDAPRHVAVHRGEIYEQLAPGGASGQAAGAPGPVGKGSVGADTPE